MAVLARFGAGSVDGVGEAVVGMEKDGKFGGGKEGKDGEEGGIV